MLAKSSVRRDVAFCLDGAAIGRNGVGPSYIRRSGHAESVSCGARRQMEVRSADGRGGILPDILGLLRRSSGASARYEGNG